MYFTFPQVVTEEVPAPEVLDPLPQLASSEVEEEVALAASVAEEEAALVELSEVNAWSDAAYQQTFPESDAVGEASEVNGVTSFNNEAGVMTMKGTGYINQQNDQFHFSYHRISDKNW